jgi:hypothetical protein
MSTTTSSENRKVETPKVGDAATWSPYNDCYPCTVIDVSPSGKTVLVQEDHYFVVSGKWPDLKYSYTRNPEGRVHRVTLRRNGHYRPSDGAYVTFGVRDRWENPSF